MELYAIFFISTAAQNLVIKKIPKNLTFFTKAILSRAFFSYLKVSKYLLTYYYNL